MTAAQEFSYSKLQEISICTELNAMKQLFYESAV